MSAASRIEQYLRDHPDGDLLIAVGYATPAGIAWLAQRTEGRRVDLLIGNTSSQYWKNVAEPDRAACLEFIRRTDVEIRNWYRTKKSRSGESDAHLKAWVVHNNGFPVSALTGSANLTRKGLENNVEVMVEAHGNDLQQTSNTAQELWGKAWQRDDRLIKYLAGSEPTGAPTATPRPATKADHDRRLPRSESQPVPHHEHAPSPSQSSTQPHQQIRRQTSALSLDSAQAKNPLRILAVVGLFAAIANGAALGLVLSALGVSEFFSSWALPAFFVCSSLTVGAMCYWISTRAEGTDRGLAITGAAAAALPLAAGLVTVAVLLVVMVVTVLLLLLALTVLRSR